MAVLGYILGFIDILEPPTSHFRLLALESDGLERPIGLPARAPDLHSPAIRQNDFLHPTEGRRPKRPPHTRVKVNDTHGPGRYPLPLLK